MRLLVITDKLLPSDHSFVQGVLQTALPALGVEVTFFGFSHTRHGRWGEGGVRYRAFRPWPGGVAAEALQLVARFVPLLLGRARYDAVFTRNDPVALLLGRLYRARHRRARHAHQISFLHAEGLLAQGARGGARLKAYGDLLLRNALLPGVDRVFAVSAQMARDLRRRHPRMGARLDHLPLGVLPADFEGALPYEARPIEAAYVGTLGAARRLEVVVEAVARYNADHGPLTLHVWGASHDPQDDEALRGHVARLGMQQRVLLLGRLPRAEVLERLKRTQVGLCAIPPEGVFVHSSPTKLMEDMAAGCCVVATSGIDDQERIVRESGGGVLVAFTPEAIAAGLRRALGDPTFAARAAARGRAYILEHRDYAAMARKVKRLLLDREGA